MKKGQETKVTIGKITKLQSKLNKKQVKNDDSDYDSEEDEDDEGTSEEEEGQIMLPSGIITDDISQLIPDEQYLIVYTR